MFTKRINENKSTAKNFRCFFLKTDISLARKGILLFIIPLVAFLFNDFLFLNLTEGFYSLLALRIFLLSISVAAFLLIEKVTDYNIYDNLITLTSLTLLAGCGIINAMRPQNFIAQVLMTVVAIFILYLVIPNRLLYKCFLSVVASVGEGIILILFIQPANLPTIFTIFLSLVFTNIIGGFTAWQLQSYQKKIYSDIEKEEELHEMLNENMKNLEKAVEERTRDLKNAERLAAIGATAGMVGHDIRNPLQAITSDVYLVKCELNETSDTLSKRDIEESLDSIEKNVEYVNKIVEDLQDFARPLVPNMQEIDLGKLFDETLLEKVIPENIFVTWRTEFDANKLVTDQALLKRILSNLVNNAIQAMPNGGSLEISACPQGDYLTIVVRDTGIGIPEEIQPKIFTPLFTTKSKGQGFGLAVVKRVTETLGGKVFFETEKDRGTKFIVRLPAGREASKYPS